MPLARIVTRHYDEASPLVERLKKLGYTVEIFEPEQLRLSEAERTELEAVVRTGRAAARKRLHAQILLKADEGEHGPAWTANYPGSRGTPTPRSAATPCSASLRCRKSSAKTAS